MTTSQITTLPRKRNLPIPIAFGALLFATGIALGSASISTAVGFDAAGNDGTEGLSHTGVLAGEAGTAGNTDSTVCVGASSTITREDYDAGTATIDDSVTCVIGEGSSLSHSSAGGTLAGEAGAVPELGINVGENNDGSGGDGFRTPVNPEKGNAPKPEREGAGPQFQSGQSHDWHGPADVSDVADVLDELEVPSELLVHLPNITIDVDGDIFINVYVTGGN